jgi:hypothetical protein
MAVEICGVSALGLRASRSTDGPNDDLITGAWLDSPHTGPVYGHRFDVYGWVVSTAPIAEVEFVHEQSVVARCELDVFRPDVAEAYGSSSQVGFRTAIETSGLAPDFTIKVRVVFQDGRRRQMAEIRGTQQLTSAFTGAGGTGAAATTTGKAGSEGANGGTGGTAGHAGAPRTGATAAAATGGVVGAWGAGGEGTGGTARAGSTADAGGTGGAGRRWRRRHRR